MSTPLHPWAGAALAWLATYLLHSTLLLALAALASRPLARRSIRAEEAVWRTALLGALLTATLQLAAGYTPLGGQWRIGVDPIEAPAAVGPIEARTAGSAAGNSATGELSAAADPARRESISAVPGQPAPVVTAVAPGPGVSWPALLLGLWAAGALALALRLGSSWVHLRRSLRPRLEIVGGTMSRLLARLAAETGFGKAVRLTCAYRLPVPVAVGTRRPEISVPPRALSHLEPDQQESLLAHELAHLARRDPAWLVAVQLVTTVFFFQPLNWLARRRLREISELLCDEWAVSRTGRPVTLARCLAEVARWPFESHLQPARSLPVPGMSGIPGGSSQLAHRIRRLLAGEGEIAGRRPRWLVPALAALVLATAALAPGFSARAEEEKAAAVAAEPEEPAEPAEPMEPMEPLDPAEPALAADLADLDELDEIADREDLADEEDVEDDEEMEALEREADRISREIEQRIRPEMRRLERDIEGRVSGLMRSTGEMEKLQREIEAMAERMRPSAQEIERIQREARAMAGKDALTAEERERIVREARRLAEAAKPSEQEIAEIRRMAEQHAKMARDLHEKHRPEIEAARADAMRQVEAIREQVRRDIEPEIKALREQQRKIHERRRHEHRREIRHQEIRREKPGAPIVDIDIDPVVPDIDVDVDVDIDPEVPDVDVDIDIDPVIQDVDVDVDIDPAVPDIELDIDVEVDPEVAAEPKVEVRAEAKPRPAAPPR